VIIQDLTPFRYIGVDPTVLDSLEMGMLASAQGYWVVGRRHIRPGPSAMKLAVQSSRARETPPVGDALLACLSGVLMALPFLNFRLWPLSWFALVPLLLAINGKGRRTSFALSYLAGCVFFALVLHWLFSLVYWVGGVVLAGVLLLIAYLAVYWGLFGLLASYARERFGARVWFTGAAIWVLLEYVESKLFTGFGWALVGYTQAYAPGVVQWASVGGVFLVSAIIILSNTMIYSVIVEGRRRGLRLVVTLLVFCLIPLGAVLVRAGQSGKTLRVAVIQGNFAQDVKWNPDYLADSVFVHERLSSEAARDGAELIVWSESAIPATLERNPRIKEDVERYADYKGVHLLLGAIRAGQPPERGQFNSAYLINPDGEIVDWYDKMHLAPFGEYVPLRRVLPFIGRIMPVLSDLSAGKRRTVFNVRGVKFGTLICFETVFPDLVRAMAREDTDFLITITNTAWFGRSAAAFQDLAICVFRAVENRIWLVRSANTGVSCFIDPWGAVKSRVGSVQEPVFVRGWSIENVRANKGFSIYRIVGNLFVLLCGLWLVVAGFAGSRRARKRRRLL